MEYNDLDNLSLKDLVIFDKTWSTVGRVSFVAIPVSLTYAFVSGDLNGVGVAAISALTSFTGYHASVTAKCKIMERKSLASSIVKRSRKRHAKSSW